MTLKQKLLEAKLILPESFFEKLEVFTDTFLAWNRVHNLSGATTVEEVEYHVYDSLYPLTFLEEFENALDIGTGAGFPGLVLAMARGHTPFTLVEPLQKRAGFLNFVKATVKLGNVTVENRRSSARRRCMT